MKLSHAVHNVVMLILIQTAPLSKIQLATKNNDKCNADTYRTHDGYKILQLDRSVLWPVEELQLQGTQQPSSS